jgi:hypothetical protein
MITGKTLPQLANEIKRQHDAAKDYVVRTNVLEMDNNAHLTAGGLSFGIRDIAHAQLSEFTKIPRKYYDRMKAETPELLAQNVNHWFKTSSANRMLRTLDGSARAFLSDKYRRVDNWQIAEAALPVLADFPGLKIQSAEVTERRMYIYAVTDRIQGEVKVGDLMQMGIRISNSEVGYGMINISPTLLRLQCMNGLTIDEGAMKSRHLGRSNAGEGDELQEMFSNETKTADDRVLMMKIRDLVRNTLTETFFNKQLERMKEATVIEIRTDVPTVVESTVELLGLTQTEGSGVLRHLIAGGDLSKWGLVNAVTALANDHESYDRAAEIMELGNDVLSLDPKAWDRLVKNDKPGKAA